MPDDRFLHRRAGHSQKVNLLTDLEYRVWTQYILSADDFGVMRGTHHPIQNDNDHLENRPPKVIQKCLDALVASGLIHRFEHQGKPYVYQHDWQDWQKVEYPRRTINPKPTADALKVCDEKTRQLFAKWPGGERRKNPKDAPNDSARTSRTNSEDTPTTRGGAPAERLTANGTGERREANGGGLPTLVTDDHDAAPMDRWLERLRDDYPQQAVTSGHLTERAFFDALTNDPRGPKQAYEAMLSNLENQKRGYQWRMKRMIPRLDKWLREGLWQQQHDENAPVSEQLTTKTNRTLSAAAEVLGKRPA